MLKVGENTVKQTSNSAYSNLFSGLRVKSKTEVDKILHTSKTDHAVKELKVHSTHSGAMNS